MRWARSTFLAVIGKNAPALTVASLAMIITRRPATVPMPVTTPADGAPPQSAYMLHAAHRPSSKKSDDCVDEPGDAFAGGEAVFIVLAFNGVGAAALQDDSFLLAEFGEERRNLLHAGSYVGRLS